MEIKGARYNQVMRQCQRSCENEKNLSPKIRVKAVESATTSEVVSPGQKLMKKVKDWGI